MITAEEEKFLMETDGELTQVKNFILTALVAKGKGDTSHYNHIVQQLRVREDREMVGSVFIGLGSCVSLFTQRPDLYRDLIESLFSYDWKGNKRVNVAYASLLGHVVSSNVTFLVSAFRMLVRNLVPSSSSVPKDDVSSTDLAVQRQQEAENERRDWIHRTLKSLIAVVPTGQSELFPVIMEHFPHKRFPKHMQCEFVSQLLHICEYVPILQESVLGLIVSKCLEIDVDIVIEDSGVVKIQEEYDGEVGDDMFVMGEESGGGSTTPCTSKRIYSEGAQRISDEVVESADKLDGMLILLVEFIQTKIDKGGDLMNRLAHQWLAVFEEKILLTHRSKFVQFVMFYFASKVTRFRDAFGTSLLRLFLDESAAHLRRQSAILYLASYLARANFISIQSISDMMMELLAWGETYVIQREKEEQARSSSQLDLEIVEVDEFGRLQTAQESNISRHETFFSCVQAVCYVLCFYGVEMATLQKNLATARRRWERVISCKLQPLRYCLQSVRVEFLRLAQHVGLLGPTAWACISHDLLPPDLVPSPTLISIPGQSNSKNQPPKRIQPSHHHRYQGIKMGAGYNPLDSFFPYDPCLLQLLHHHIESSYRAWKGLPGVDDMDDGNNNLTTLIHNPEDDDENDTSIDDKDNGGDGTDDEEAEMTQSLSSLLSSAMSTSASMADGIPTTESATSLSPTRPGARGSIRDHTSPYHSIPNNHHMNNISLSSYHRSVETRTQSLMSDYSLEGDHTKPHRFSIVYINLLATDIDSYIDPFLSSSYIHLLVCTLCTLSNMTSIVCVGFFFDR